MIGFSRPIAATIIVAIGWLAPANAADQPDAARATLSDPEIERRLDFLEQRLDAGKRHAQIWYWSWLTVNGGATVALSVASALADDADDRAAYIPQAALAALGVADLTVIRPLRARVGAEPMRNLPEATRAQRLAKLERRKRCCAATPSGPRTAGPGCCISRTSASTPPQAR